MTIYFIRHGESLANEKDLFLGHGDLDLTKKGYEQAKKTAEFLRSAQIDVIYSSDLQRAFHTAQPTAEIKGLPIIKEKGFREIDAGEWDFKPFSELKTKYKKTYDLWRDDYENAHCDGGESVKKMLDRIVKTLLKVIDKHPNKNIAIFMHATPIRCLASYFKGNGVAGTKDVPWANNASVTIVDFADGKFNVIEYGKDDFMRDLRTGLPEDL